MLFKENRKWNCVGAGVEDPEPSFRCKLRLDRNSKISDAPIEDHLFPLRSDTQRRGIGFPGGVVMARVSARRQFGFLLWQHLDVVPRNSPIAIVIGPLGRGRL